MSSDENDPLGQYKLQLMSVEKALKEGDPDNQAELLDLKEKLTEVISLLGGGDEETSIPNDTEEEVIDDEFLRFQKEINALEGNSSSQQAHASEENDESDMHNEFYSVLSSMEGNKCRAPFMREWGERGYHNAIIFSTDQDEDIADMQEIQVRVMFCNPLCDQMKPCPFFLDGHCKFTDEKCRFSHGCPVKFSDIEEYIFPDYSKVERDTRCLAKYKDGLWYSAVVENCLDDQQYFIKYTNSGETDTLNAHDILPIEGLSLSDDESSSDSSDQEEEVNQKEIESASQHISKEINYEVASGSSALGSWEQHTKGIGSKIMAKMGYVWGQGLGKDSDGRIEPVEAIVLPKGKSLDKCAEIRDQMGLESVEEKFNSEQAREKQRVKNIEQGPESSVFAFLNQNLSRNSGPSSTGGDFQLSRKRSSGGAENLPGKCPTKSLNFEMYSVGEEIKKAKKEIMRLQQSVKRNADKNKAACSVMKQKMTAQTCLLKSLEAKEQRISGELKKTNNKKLAVF